MIVCGDNPFPNKHFQALRRAGFEPATFGFVDRCNSNTSNVNTSSCDTCDSSLTPSLARLAHDDAELALILTAWPELPDAIRAAIVAIVTTADSRSK